MVLNNPRETGSIQNVDSPRDISGSPFTISSSAFEHQRHNVDPNLRSNSSRAHNLFSGLPSIHPLDYSALITTGTTHSELAHTVDGLIQWLTVIETGLNGMLDQEYSDTILEEQDVIENDYFLVHDGEDPL